MSVPDQLHRTKMEILSWKLEVYCRKGGSVVNHGRTLKKGSDYRYDPQTQKLAVSFTGPANVLIKDAEGLFD